MATKTRNALNSRLGAAASRQFGVLSRGQLRGFGMSDSAIKHAVRTGRLHPIFRGVYAFGRASISQKGRLFAAALMGLDRGPTSIHVIGPAQRGRTIDGIRPHLVSPLQLDERGTFDGIPCTSPARTVVDVASEVGMRTLRSCFERAAARGLLDVVAVEASLRPG